MWQTSQRLFKLFIRFIASNLANDLVYFNYFSNYMLSLCKALIMYQQHDEGPTVRITHKETFVDKMRLEKRVTRWTEEQFELRNNDVTLMSVGRQLIGLYNPTQFKIRVGRDTWRFEIGSFLVVIKGNHFILKNFIEEDL